MRRRRIPLTLLGTTLLTVSIVTPSALAQPAPTIAFADVLRNEAGGALKRVYAERGYRALWVDKGRIGPQAQGLIGYLDTARADGLDPSSYGIDHLRQAIAAARGGDIRAVAQAELALSDAFVRYVRDQRRPSSVRMIYADKTLKPRRPKAETVLRAAMLAPAFGDYLRAMAWMSPLYVQQRQLMIRAGEAGGQVDARRLRLNLDRARLLPGAWTPHIVVDASSARLFYYAGGKQIGMMKVVVGAQETQTPMLAGTLQWAILNPYWNVPDYLVRKSIAVKVLGGRSLATMRMEALSDWSADPQRLDASRIDWPAVAAGRQDLRVRQLPGPGNSMGRVKFLFPNQEGVYLHDTPDRQLFAKPDRHFSNGCVRLEDAATLGRWLLQRPVKTTSAQAEQAVALPMPIPVYLTYLTATATDRGVAFRPDVYARDDR